MNQTEPSASQDGMTHGLADAGFDDSFFSSQWEADEFLQLDLHSAASIGDIERVLELSSDGTLNSINRGNWTALMYAAHNNQLQVVSELLQLGADCETRNAKGLNALMLAASCGHEEVVSALAKAGANLNAVDEKGLSALSYAARLNHAYAVQLLLSLGANPNLREPAFGFTPFLVACAEGHEMCVQYFLDCNCDPDSKLNNGQTAKMVALCNNHVKIATLLESVSAHRRQTAALPRRNDLLVGPNIVAALIKNGQHKPPLNVRSKQLPQNSALDKIDPISAFMEHLRSVDGDISKVNILTPSAPIPQSLPELFEGLQLQKYLPAFDEHHIDLATFIELTDSDLKEIGIKLLGPRKKMLNAICRLQAQCPPIGNVMEQAVANYYKALSEEHSRKAEQAAKELEAVNKQLEKHMRKTEAVERLYAAQRTAIDSSVSYMKDAKRCVQDLYSVCQRAISAKLPDSVQNVMQSVESHASKIAITLDQCLLKFAQVSVVQRK